MEQLSTLITTYGQDLLRKSWFFPVINGAALLLLTAGMANWTWQIVQPPKSKVVAPVLSPASQARSAAFDLDSLLATELFGRFEQPAEASLENIPISSLNLVLTGVVAAGSGSFALISVDGKEESSFAVGQEITAGTMLHAVYPDRAILLRYGVQESLMLAETVPSLPANAVVSSRGHSERVKRLGTNQYRVQRSLISEQIKNPEFLSQALIVPHASGGFLVRNIKPGSVYEDFGLKQGDVIKKVNGRDVNTMDDVMQIYQQLGSIDQLSQLQMEIQRGGKQENLNYQLQ